MNAPYNSKRKLSYRENQHLPDDGRRREIIDGDHYGSPATSTKHQSVSRKLHFELCRIIEVPKRGQVFNAPTDVELELRDIAQPDLIVIMNVRINTITDNRICTATISDVEVDLNIVRGRE